MSYDSVYPTFRPCAQARNGLGRELRRSHPAALPRLWTHTSLHRGSISPSFTLPMKISYLWPECVIRAKMSRRLSGTVAPANSARSAGLHFPIVVLMAVAHLSMLSALG
jgi:hypothetical protein